MQRVAILGLGIMGGGMAANWLAKGFAVSVWNRTRAKAEALAGKGAKIAATPREAATGADFIFAMVADDAASRSVWLGADGALAGAKSGAIGVESSTLTPDWVRELARQAQAKGVGFLDAPVGGSRPGGGVRGTQVLCRRRPSNIRSGAPRARRGRQQDGSAWACRGGRHLEAHQQPARRGSESPRSPKRSRSPKRLVSEMSKSPSSSWAALLRVRSSS